MIDNNEIEKRLASAFDAAAPDMLDDLMTELHLNEESEPAMRDKLAEDTEGRYRKAAVRSRSFRRLISCAAALILIAGGATVWRNINQKVLATVDLDVNPSIELSINSKEKVVDARPVNAEGEAILEDMDLKGSDVKVACNAIVGSMLTKGYLTDRSNSILLSVFADDPAKGREIEERLAGDINEYMETSVIAPSVLGQYMNNDVALRDFAVQKGISQGKAWLIRKLLDSGAGKMTEESLLALSTQELIVLSQERDVQSETKYGKADTGKYVSRDKALEAALRHVGLDRTQISDAGTEMDCEDGVIIYEVEFRSGAYEYEYDINASTGAVIRYEMEGRGSGASARDDDDDDEYDRDDDDDD